MDIKDSNTVYHCMLCHQTYDYLPQDGECLICHQKKLRFVKLDIINPHFSQIIKIQSSEIINSMRAGNLWFQSPRCFHEYSGDGQQARADIHDAKYSYIDKNAYVHDENADTYRLLCFYSLNVDTDGNFLEKPDKRLLDFGDCFSIVGIETLLAKVKSYLIDLNKEISYVANFVYYLLENYSGVYTPFCKFFEYSYQNEFRIVLLSDKFISLGKKPYITIPLISNLSNVFSEPIPLTKLFSVKKLKDL